MIVYAVVMFLTAFILILVGALVYRGRTDLVHSYHQTNVKDKKAYGKALGKALMGMSIPFILAGIIGLFTESILVTIVLLAGIAISFIPFAIVQNKHNGGIF